MLSASLTGEQQFRKGLIQYLNQYKGLNTNTDDLWNSLTQVRGGLHRWHQCSYRGVMCLPDFRSSSIMLLPWHQLHHAQVLSILLIQNREDWRNQMRNQIDLSLGRALHAVLERLRDDDLVDVSKRIPTGHRKSQRRWGDTHPGALPAHLW